MSTLPRWHHLSVRHKLMVLSLLPLVVVLPLLLAALVIWGNAAFDRLLTTKVRSDLAVAHGYFGQVLNEVGSGALGVANSHTLHLALTSQNLPELKTQLTKAQLRLGLDFINLYSARGELVAASGTTPATAPKSLAILPTLRADPDLPGTTAKLQLLSQRDMLALAPHLAARLQIPLIPTVAAEPSARTHENQALVMMTTLPVLGSQGEALAWIKAGLLLNQNLALIDHINHIVYPEGSLQPGSAGTATLFLDDVRITTNVRLFQNQRAIGTRVSQAVHDAVLERGETWLDRAFVVNSWYVSAYEPLQDSAGERIGMLYVGYLEAPYRLTKYGILAFIIGIFALVMVLAAWLSVRWARSIFQPVELMNRTMQQVEDGRNAARVGPLKAHDELGALARHLDQLLNVIDDKTHTLQRWGQEQDAKVAERTHELSNANQALQQAQTQLVKSEKLAAIGQITASVAHEINNPIAVMQGNLDLLRETLGQHARPVADELLLLDQQVDRMRLIVTQLLQYARPTDYAGYLDAIDANVAVDNALVLVEYLLAHSRITVQRQLQASQTVSINLQELQQVLVNLLINAIQAMPDDGTLTLRTQNHSDEQGHAGVLITVSDTGSGLNEATQNKLFSPFFTTKREGNGLGLWTSVGLVERYGGNITAANRRDLGEASDGAAFKVWLLCELPEPT